MCKASAIAFGLMLMSVPRMGAIDFSREIQPILSDRCYFCHGPDEKNNKADLRLDTAEGAREVLKNGELRVRILSDDKDEIMPPPKSKLKLTAAERDLIRRWIDDGGKYEQHWAFVAPRQDIPLPAVSDPAWPKATLDHFILARLDAEKLRPAPPADGLRWLRRVTFDLTGLPPSAEEIAAFLQTTG